MGGLHCARRQPHTPTNTRKCSASSYYGSGSNDVPYFHLLTPSCKSPPNYRLGVVNNLTRYCDGVLALLGIRECLCLPGITQEGSPTDLPILNCIRSSHPSNF